MVLIPKLAAIDAYIPHRTHTGVTSRFANPRAMASWREGTKLSARMHTNKIVHSSSFQLFWAERIASSSQSISLVNCFFLISVSRSFYCALLSSHEVASPVTLDEICPIILKFRRVTRVYILFQATCLSPTQRALVSLQSKLQKLLCLLHSEYCEVRRHPPSDPSGLIFYLRQKSQNKHQPVQSVIIFLISQFI